MPHFAIIDQDLRSFSAGESPALGMVKSQRCSPLQLKQCDLNLPVWLACNMLLRQNTVQLRSNTFLGFPAFFIFPPTYKTLHMLGFFVQIRWTKYTFTVNALKDINPLSPGLSKELQRHSVHTKVQCILSWHMADGAKIVEMIAAHISPRGVKESAPVPLSS